MENNNYQHPTSWWIENVLPTQKFTKGGSTKSVQTEREFKLYLHGETDHASDPPLEINTLLLKFISNDDWINKWNKWKKGYNNFVLNCLQQNLPFHKLKLKDLDLHNLIINRNEKIGNIHPTERTYLDMRDIDFSWLEFDNVNFDHLDLHGSNFSHTNMMKIEFNYCKLENANFIFSGLILIRFEGCNFRNTSFQLCVLDVAKFFGFSEDDNEVNYHKSIFSTVDFVSFNLTKALNINTIFHRRKGAVDYDTLMISKNLPPSFYFGYGISQMFIDNLPSLQSTSISFYDCFISYAEIDEQFSKRLYDGLTSAGIRCWRWKEDLRYGQTIRYGIESSIKKHEKLILILSKDSLESQAVIDEIDAGIYQENELRKTNKTYDYIFPIMLDKTIMSWDHPNQRFIMQKHIGDFCDWKQEDAFQLSLQRLIKDLKKI
ncbi:MAG: hypothetical protein HeimC2_13840 [Candidatus Heimdallarchaeota archaeon LC_2]|nr:MAG: hypothetical protein HeimC2_13840 [Candidatus Heimdallarchaeota archaeon LC_2]